MKTSSLIASTILTVALSVSTASAQRSAALGDNAALRYWAAFAQMQDSSITDQQAKEMNAVLDGITPYTDAKYKDLVEKNQAALQTMARATALPKCEWGLDYELGEDTPVDYARKGLALGRLNVLYAFHLLSAGDKDAAVGALAVGLRYSQDVANGGSLFATLAAKSLIVSHLTALVSAMHAGALSATQRLTLQKAVAQLGPEGLDWQSAAKRDLEALRGRYSRAPQAVGSLTRIIASYTDALNAPSKLPALKEAIDGAPEDLASVIPSPKRVLEEKRGLTDKLAQTRSLVK